ncbi:DNA mismatch repair protein MutS [Alkalihalophilus lindianensis]|uniref:DNA mismatch repair protein MutS n=1 Tax=Alkalihalophilus lindianensis TaxID=1630542 RepID=A0ABU3XCE5_9BACI|nr:DNA mismatch repair protein MutS [Alkalihalophilus lindianensis]MDV2685513.1 DNA mismatch repair protein MutS [Alkalihalophilus lindianensis]
MAQLTPMMQQYVDIKAQHQDAFLFFRLGDFYEMFFDDAIKAAQELEITLTGRGQGEERIPMCGVPYHSADQYMSRLVEKGYKVAICEQVEDPKVAKGVVKREVVKMLTPGTIMEGKMIREKENNYLASFTIFEDESMGIARCDLTTGEGAVTLIQGGQAELIQELSATGAKELVVSKEVNSELLQELERTLAVTISHEEEAELNGRYVHLVKELTQSKLVTTYARLLQYLIRTQKRSLDHLQKVEWYHAEEYMKLDLHSKRNLELVETLREKKKKGSLLSIVDHTVTAMGGRLIKRWIERPLLNESAIEKRHEAVTVFLEDYFAREELRDELRQVYDLERLAGRIAYGNVNARELIQLKKSLQKIPLIEEMVTKLDPSFQERWFHDQAPFEDLIDLLERSIVEDPPISIKDGGMIQEGFHGELDTYRDASVNGKKWIAELERRERQETGIKSLKVGFNKVFGYYLEVTRANRHLLEEGRYERKQTLTNSERFVTPELKEKEALILEAEEKMEQLEYDLFVMIREQVKEYVPHLQSLAHKISEIDVLLGFATVSEKQHYTKPILQPVGDVFIEGGRHPVVESVIPKGEYVANDVKLYPGREMLLITGPNMAGKSTYMRQLALLSVMGQIGCFVPADRAELPIFDQIFTRIGAADDLASGQSTFMVEMLETQYALAKATECSLILLDEIGRGTSTYDGMALAQAIIEYIHDEIGAKTLFSTHYHELTALADQLEHVQNVHVSAVEENGTVVFLHKVIDGQADRSYGIYVAQLAELPRMVTDRAEVLLRELEGQKQPLPNVIERSIQETQPPQLDEVKEPQRQLSLFGEEITAEERKAQQSKAKKLDPREQQVIKKISEADLLNLSPFEVMKLINDCQQQLK